MITSSKKPNILFIVVDCLRSDRCPVESSNTNLKFWPKLVQRGITFTQMMSSTTNTSPCFASMLSGYYPHNHGIRTVRGPAIHSQIKTLPEILQANGYSTHAFVTGPLLNVLGLDKGFDQYDHREREENIYSKWQNNLWRFFDYVDSGKPFFSLLHFFEVHCPRQTNGIKTKNVMEEYDISWQQLDNKLNMLLELVPDDTIIIFTADHGEAVVRRADLSIPGYMTRKVRKLLNMPRRPIDNINHGLFPFDEIVRIPFNISGPGLQQNKVIYQQVRQVDITPTLLDILGINDNRQRDGVSLAPYFDGSQLPDLPAVIESGQHLPTRDWKCFQTSKWKYVENKNDVQLPVPSQMLFDHANDPFDKVDLAETEPEVAIEMKKELDAFMANPKFDTQGKLLKQNENSKLEKQLKHLGYL